jgi:predicted dehydrogenase
MRPEMGPPDTTVWEYPGPDESWTSEFADFLDDIALGREPDPGLSAAAAALEIVETIYTRSGYPRVAVTTRHQPQ